MTRVLSKSSSLSSSNFSSKTCFSKFAKRFKISKFVTPAEGMLAERVPFVTVACFDNSSTLFTKRSFSLCKKLISFWNVS